MVTACYKPVVNGVTRMVSLYKQQLEALGHEVLIFTWGEPDANGEEAGVVRSPGLPLGDTGYYFGVGYCRKAQELVRQMDILHCHHLVMSLEMAYRYGRCPIVYTNHSRYDLYTGVYTPLPQPIADRVLRLFWPKLTDLADLVIAPSVSLKGVLESFGVRQRIEVVANGVDLQPFCQPKRVMSRELLGVEGDGLVLIFVGRLAAEKGVRLLLEQVAVVMGRVPALSLILVGDGPQKEELQQYALKLGIAGSTHFVGVVAYEDVPAFLAAADLFVTASVSEVHPLTVIEAMAAGLPVVGVQSLGMVDIVENGITGLLTYFPQGGLAAAILELVLDKQKRQQFAYHARQASQQYGIRQTVQQTVALYEELLLQGNKSGGE